MGLFDGIRKRRLARRQEKQQFADTMSSLYGDDWQNNDRINSNTMFEQFKAHKDTFLNQAGLNKQDPAQQAMQDKKVEGVEQKAISQSNNILDATGDDINVTLGLSSPIPSTLSPVPTPQPSMAPQIPSTPTKIDRSTMQSINAGSTLVAPGARSAIDDYMASRDNGGPVDIEMELALRDMGLPTKFNPGKPIKTKRQRMVERQANQFSINQTDGQAIYRQEGDTKGGYWMMDDPDFGPVYVMPDGSTYDSGLKVGNTDFTLSDAEAQKIRSFYNSNFGNNGYR